MTQRILVVDDERLQRWTVRKHLESWGYEVAEAETHASAVAKYAGERPDMVLLDLRLGEDSGLDVLRDLKALDPDVAVIMITAHGDLSDAVAGFRLGLVDFFQKPIDPQALRTALRYRFEATQLRHDIEDLREREAQAYDHGIVGQSAALATALDKMRRVASSASTTVLLQGESGTGKDLFAKALHFASPRRHAPFVAVNCAALPDTLLESELFGHERGAFTDARAAKRGVFELAHGGTLYLDEIGEMTPALQAKLLRVLETPTFRRVGGVADITVDTRVVAASNRDLATLARDGAFRQDLYYRLSVVTLSLPPLRERPDDIPLLATHFVEQLGQKLRRPKRGLTPDALQRLREHDWPGNIRELRNAIERAVILDDDALLSATHLSLPTAPPLADEVAATGTHRAFELPEDGVSLDHVEAVLVEQAMARAGGNQTRAAQLLGISRYTLRYKLKQGRGPAPPDLESD